MVGAGAAVINVSKYECNYIWKSSKEKKDSLIVVD